MSAVDSSSLQLPLTEELAAEMAERCPNELLELLVSGTLQPFEMYSAAEYAGRTQRPEAFSILVSLLEDSNNLVREGAVLGLAGFLPESRSVLCKILELDPHPSVKEAAKNILTP
jgi:HEAT repeat protein